MPERKPVPPVRLQGALPDGSHNGLADAAKRFLVDKPGPAYAVVKVARRAVSHDDDTDADTAILRILAIEIPDDEQTALASVLTRCRQERVSMQPQLPLAHDRARYEQQLGQWQREHKMSNEDLRAAWEEFFITGDEDTSIPVGPLGAEITHLVEFVLETCGSPDD